MENTSNIAVFIDFENFPSGEFDAKKIITKLKEKGRILLKKAYADWGRFAADKRIMLENSIDLIELPSHKNKGKNSSDIKLVVDALETAFTKDYIDTFVVVSGDSDYTPLISKLRELNKYVIVIGHKKNMSSLLAGYCDEVHFYSNFVGNVTSSGNIAELAPVFDLLTRSVIALKDTGSNTLGSRVKQYMRQLDSSFDEKKYGFSTLGEFWRKATAEKIISFTETNSGDYEISLYQTGNRGEYSQLETDHNTPIDSQGKPDIQYFIYWATQLYPEEQQQRLDINLLAQGIRQLDKDYSLPKYGYSNTSGLKGMLKDIEKKGMIRLFEEKKTNNTDYFIKPLEKLVVQYESSTKPYNFELIKEIVDLSTQVSVYKKYLRECGYNADLEKIEVIFSQISTFLYQLEEGKFATINDILAHCVQSLQALYSEAVIRAVFKTLAESGLFLDEESYTIEDLNSPYQVVSAEPDNDIQSMVTIFLTKQLQEKFGDDIDARKLQFLFYREID
ncbi:MAG: NYN domain-containing protein [Bacteroidia bacterium]